MIRGSGTCSDCLSASNSYFFLSSLFKKAMVEIAGIQKMILVVKRKIMTLRKREVRRTRKKVKMKN